MDRFSNLRKLKKEAEVIKRELDELSFVPKEWVADTVKDYRTGYPRTVVIEGYGNSEYARRRDRLYKAYARKLEAIQDEIESLEEKLAEVEDPELRAMLRLRYINGLTLEQIADEVGYSVITIKRRFKEFYKTRKVDTE